MDVVLDDNAGINTQALLSVNALPASSVANGTCFISSSSSCGGGNCDFLFDFTTDVLTLQRTICLNVFTAVVNVRLHFGHFKDAIIHGCQSKRFCVSNSLPHKLHFCFG